MFFYMKLIFSKKFSFYMISKISNLLLYYHFLCFTKFSFFFFLEHFLSRNIKYQILKIYCDNKSAIKLQRHLSWTCKIYWDWLSLMRHHLHCDIFLMRILQNDWLMFLPNSRCLQDGWDCHLIEKKKEIEEKKTWDLSDLWQL